MNPYFTIVTCTWNSVSTLEDTIRSVRSQRYQGHEHIFVDGGSTDGTLELIARLSPNGRVVQGVSGGVSRAMNAGIQQARGSVLVNLHADDYFKHDGVLDTVQAAFSRSGRRWVVGRIDVLREGEISPLPSQGAFSVRRFRSRGFSIPHPATFVETALLRQCNGFDEHLRYAMDIDLWQRMLRVCEPEAVDEPFTVFRMHAGSLSTANRRAARLEEWRVRAKYARDDWFAALLMHGRMARDVVRVIRAERA